MKRGLGAEMEGLLPVVNVRGVPQKDKILSFGDTSYFNCTRKCNLSSYSS
jgi:hypothetical protein